MLQDFERMSTGVPEANGCHTEAEAEAEAEAAAALAAAAAASSAESPENGGQVVDLKCDAEKCCSLSPHTPATESQVTTFGSPAPTALAAPWPRDVPSPVSLKSPDSTPPSKRRPSGHRVPTHERTAVTIPSAATAATSATAAQEEPATAPAQQQQQQQQQQQLEPRVRQISSASSLSQEEEQHWRSTSTASLVSKEDGTGSVFPSSVSSDKTAKDAVASMSTIQTVAMAVLNDNSSYGKMQQLHACTTRSSGGSMQHGLQLPLLQCPKSQRHPPFQSNQSQQRPSKSNANCLKGRLDSPARMDGDRPPAHHRAPHLRPQRGWHSEQGLPDPMEGISRSRDLGPMLRSEESLDSADLLLSDTSERVRSQDSLPSICGSEMNDKISFMMDAKRSRANSIRLASKWFEGENVLDERLTQRLAMFTDVLGAVGAQLDRSGDCDSLLKLTSIVELHSKELLNCEGAVLFVKVKRQGRYMLTTTLENAQEVVIPIDSGLLGVSIFNRAAVNIPDVTQDPRWDASIDMATKRRTKSFLCVPIFRQKGDVANYLSSATTEDSASNFAYEDVLGVLQVTNKLETSESDATPTSASLPVIPILEDKNEEKKTLGKPASFRAQDEHMLKSMAALSAIGMQVDEAVWSQRRDAERLEALGGLMGSLAELTCSDRGVIFNQVRNEATRLCQCELGVILELDETRDFFSADLPNGTRHQLRLPPSWAGTVVDLDHLFIAATVASTGSPVMISDSPSDSEWQNCTEHRRFGLNVLHSAVAIPIFKSQADGKQEVFGVLQLFNKTDSKGRRICFDDGDVRLLKGLCSYAASAITISSTLKTSTAAYKPLDETLMLAPKEARFKRSSSASKLFDYNSEDGSEAADLMFATLSRNLLEGTNFLDWDFDPNLLDQSELVGLLPAVFSAWDLQSDFRISDEAIDIFGRKVCAQYLPNPFHNSHHAWSVLQACNHVLFTLGAEASSLLCKVDILALLVAALCHDLGHPGTTNIFQQRVCSPLALRYNDISILENHHAASCFELLSENSDGNVLAHLCQKDFRTARRSICRSILSTDMSVHERDLAALRTRQSTAFSKESAEDREQLVSSVLHLGDLSNPCRSAALAEKWARLLSQEFLLQTEQEALEGIEVSRFMLNGYQTNNEIFFITTFVKPLWETMRVIFPPLSFYVDQIQANLEDLKGKQEMQEKQEEDNCKPVTTQRPKKILQRRLSFNLPKPRAYLSRAFSRQATPTLAGSESTNEANDANFSSDSSPSSALRMIPSFRISMPKPSLARRFSG